MIDYKTFEEKFIFYFNAHELAFDEKIIKDFYLFTDYMLSENEKYNLTAIKDIDEIIVKHYIDSVIVLKYFDIPERSKIIDVGTGAGFPALPIAIMRRDLRVTFLDSSNKKINFIKNIAKNIFETTERFDFFCGRAEDFGRTAKIRETYDFAVSRAVAKLNVLCELSAAFIRPGGFFIAYKSKNADEEINESKNALKTLELTITDAIDFDLTDKVNQINKIEKNEKNENKRVLVKIKKIKNISPKYPRNFSVITKKPL